ncbi:envelope-like protein [Cucumis melo var. makuwa]|uniref:Envelope-like protein n=1 Tax=Cucumis melo var. makuwa TaxID=1194695 RepID=A0A5A7V6Q3_CUCMM|nr:envelope-like protein [Cucumis melo var. makuwa]
MVNTRKGNYAAKSSEEVLEAQVSKTSMDGPATNAEHAPSASEIHMSDMDSDDLDNVLLTKLLKKNFVPDVVAEKSINPSISVHSQESSSTEGVFVPTSGLHHTSNVEPDPSLYSSLVRSSIPDNTTTSGPHIDSASAPADESIATGRIDVQNDEDEVEPVNTGVHTSEISVGDNSDPDAQPETYIS